VNCSVNRSLETLKIRRTNPNNQKLQETLKDALKFRFSGQNDLIYRAAINTEDDLRDSWWKCLTGFEQR
jgi:hypothetical protein